MFPCYGQPLTTNAFSTHLLLDVNKQGPFTFVCTSAKFNRGRGYETVVRDESETRSLSTPAILPRTSLSPIVHRARSAMRSRDQTVAQYLDTLDAYTHYGALPPTFAAIFVLAKSNEHSQPCTDSPELDNTLSSLHVHGLIWCGGTGLHSMSFDARVVRALRDSYAVFTGVAKMALASLVGFGMMGLLFGLGAVMARKFQAYTNCAEYSHG
ncbi:hypothetical protein EDB19DRAFT_1263797 [Suillus lakei]|nr:hypothetical protein EDB19DRAFT_1263797 [Suillus lakei]